MRRRLLYPVPFRTVRLPQPASLASFVPREIGYALAEGATLSPRTTGAALFVDISGFTPLTAALAAELGPTRAAEELVHHLDGVFELLVNAIHHYRGSVVGFAGDAVTCWFDGGAEPEDRAAARAVAAATGIRDALRDRHITSPSGRVFPIRVKAAIATGPASRFLVGDPAHQKFEVIAGAIMDRTARVERTITSGEVGVSPEVTELLRGHLEISELRADPHDTPVAIISRLAKPVTPDPWPGEPRLGDADVRPWMVKDVLARITRGEEALMGGFRRVAALFVKFGGIDYDLDPDAGRKLDAFVCFVQEVLAAYDGHLVDLTMGDKGSYLFAAFGALRTHEDDARRAVMAALALRGPENDADRPDALRMGIAHAQVYVGAYGCAARRTFGIVGREVIVAARLMGKAEPGQTLVTAEIAKASERSHRFDPLGPMILSGLQGPREVHLLRGESDAPYHVTTSSIAMVGRRREVALIRDALARPAAAPSATAARIVIEANAGMGKSTLLQATRHVAEASGIRLLSGGADAIRRSTAYHAWRQVFRSVFGLADLRPGRPEGHGLAERLCMERLGAMGAEWQRLAPLLNPILGLSIPDNPTTRAMEGQVRADNAHDLLIRVLQAESDQGSVVLFVEDLHWFDSASAALLRLAARDLSRMPIIATRRLSSETSHSWPVSPDAQIIVLGPLSDAETDELLRGVLLVNSIPGDLTRWIQERAEGSPFFTRELALALRDAGAVTIEDGACRLARTVKELTTQDFPDTVQGVIGSRLDRLPSQQQTAVKVASVIGRLFAIRLLGDVYPVTEDRPGLPEVLAGLTTAEIAQPVGAALEPSYLFSHALIQEVAYAGLLHQQRASLHRAIGEWIEQHPSGDAGTDVPLLAHHFAHAAREERTSSPIRGKALKYLGDAGSQALKAYINAEAVRFFNEALDLAGGEAAPDALEWHAGLAHAHMALGEFAACRRHARTALDLLDMPFPTGKAGVARQTIGELARVLWRMARRRSVFPVSDFAPPESGDQSKPGDPMPLLRVFSKSLFHQNDALGMLCCNLRSLNLADQAGPGPDVAICYGHAMMSLAVFRMPVQAKRFGERAMRIARDCQSPATLVSLYIARALVELGYANWNAACAHLEDAVKHATELGDDWQLGEAQAVLADIALFRGDFPEAALRYGEVEVNAERRGLDVQKAWCARPAVAEALQTEHWDEALVHLARQRKLIDEMSDPLIRIDALGFEALAHVGKGDDQAALGCIAAAHALIPTVSPPVAYPRYLGYRSLGEACLTLLDRDPASAARRKLAREAVGYLSAYASGFAFARPRAHLLSGWYHGLLGHHRRAAKDLATGSQLATTLGMRPEIALATALRTRFQ